MARANFLVGAYAGGQAGNIVLPMFVEELNAIGIGAPTQNNYVYIGDYKQLVRYDKSYAKKTNRPDAYARAVDIVNSTAPKDTVNWTRDQSGVVAVRTYPNLINTLWRGVTSPDVRDVQRAVQDVQTGTQKYEAAQATVGYWLDVPQRDRLTVLGADINPDSEIGHAAMDPRSFTECFNQWGLYQPEASHLGPLMGEKNDVKIGRDTGNNPFDATAIILQNMKLRPNQRKRMTAAISPDGVNDINVLMYSLAGGTGTTVGAYLIDAIQEAAKRQQKGGIIRRGDVTTNPRIMVAAMYPETLDIGKSAAGDTPDYVINTVNSTSVLLGGLETGRFQDLAFYPTEIEFAATTQINRANLGDGETLAQRADRRSVSGVALVIGALELTGADHRLDLASDVTPEEIQKFTSRGVRHTYQFMKGGKEGLDWSEGGVKDIIRKALTQDENFATSTYYPKTVPQQLQTLIMTEEQYNSAVASIVDGKASEGLEMPISLNTATDVLSVMFVREDNYQPVFKQNVKRVLQEVFPNANKGRAYVVDPQEKLSEGLLLIASGISPGMVRAGYYGYPHLFPGESGSAAFNGDLYLRYIAGENVSADQVLKKKARSRFRMKPGKDASEREAMLFKMAKTAAKKFGSVADDQNARDAMTYMRRMSMAAKGFS